MRNNISKVSPVFLTHIGFNTFFFGWFVIDWAFCGFDPGTAPIASQEGFHLLRLPFEESYVRVHLLCIFEIHLRVLLHSIHNSSLSLSLSLPPSLFPYTYSPFLPFSFCPSLNPALVLSPSLPLSLSSSSSFSPCLPPYFPSPLFFPSLPRRILLRLR